MIRRKKRRNELFGIFSLKAQNLTLFSINSMIRIRFFGLLGINLESIFARTVLQSIGAVRPIPDPQSRYRLLH